MNKIPLFPFELFRVKVGCQIVVRSSPKHHFLDQWVLHFYSTEMQYQQFQSSWYCIILLTMDWGLLYVKTKKITLFRSQIWYFQETEDFLGGRVHPPFWMRMNLVPWQIGPIFSDIKMVDLIQIWYGFNLQTLFFLFPTHFNTIPYPISP